MLRARHHGCSCKSRKDLVGAWAWHTSGVVQANVALNLIALLFHLHLGLDGLSGNWNCSLPIVQKNDLLVLQHLLAGLVQGFENLPNVALEAVVTASSTKLSVVQLVATVGVQNFEGRPYSTKLFVSPRFELHQCIVAAASISFNVI